MFGKNIYTIKQQNKVVSVKHASKQYVIGFQNAFITRKVQYTMHPEPEIVLLRDTTFSLHEDLKVHGYDIDLRVDVKATLFIPKCIGSTLHPMNDGLYHFHTFKFHEFMQLPIKDRLGVVMPYALELEDEHDFMFRACVIDPYIPAYQAIEN